MINVFKNRESKRICHGKFFPKPFSDIRLAAARMLEMLATATELKTLHIPPSNRLEKLKGDRSGQYSIRINEQWRVCFVWKGGDAHDVEIVDYY